MVWVVVVILFIFTLLLEWYVKRLSERINVLNERLQDAYKNLADMRTKFNQVNDRFNSLSERFVAIGQFEKEKLKIEQVRIDLRDFEEFYYTTLDEQTKDNYMRSVNQRVVLDRDIHDYF